MAEKIQVKYEELDQLISQIHTHAEQISAMFKQVQSQTATLARSWSGQGVDQFQREMEDQVLPALKRLSVSLEVAEETLERIKEVFLEAEEEAVKCLSEGERAGQSHFIEWIHGFLDVAGFIPGFGEIADGANAIIYLGEGRYLEAGISAAAMVPIVGDLGKVGKWGVRGSREIVETIAERGLREAPIVRIMDEATAAREIFKAKRVPLGKVPPHEIPKAPMGTVTFGDEMHKILPTKIEKELQQQYPGIRFQNTTKGYEGPDMRVDRSCKVDPGFDYIEIKPDTESGVDTFVRREWGKSEVWEGRGRLVVYDEHGNYRLIDYELSTK
jgi:WXG100 family type VII secretion target